MPRLTCRFCDAPLSETFVDLGAQPPANSFLTPEQLLEPESRFPLHAYVCGECLLVQLPAVVDPESIFRHYAYFSSYSESWLRHAEVYAEQMVERFGLDGTRKVVEIASNDGYLLRFFRQRGVPVLGIEPAHNVAEAARRDGIPTLEEFFDARLARELVQGGHQPDLLVGNNVLAHVPNLNDFVEGLALLLKSDGVLSLEFPHLLRLVEENQFDTIYHEHYSYFSLAAARRVLEAHGLALLDVQELPTHGGSLRVFARRAAGGGAAAGGRVKEVLWREREAGLERLETYRAFRPRAAATKERLLAFLRQAREQGLEVVGYGAPAKGNTLLNYCAVGPELLAYTVDVSPHKQGRYLPGTHIPIHPPSRIRETRPDVVLILPWNLREEIAAQMADVRSWGGRFAVAIPEVVLF